MRSCDGGCESEEIGGEEGGDDWDWERRRRGGGGGRKTIRIEWR